MSTITRLCARYWHATIAKQTILKTSDFCWSREKSINALSVLFLTFFQGLIHMYVVASRWLMTNTVPFLRPLLDFLSGVIFWRGGGLSIKSRFSSLSSICGSTLCANARWRYKRFLVGKPIRMPSRWHIWQLNRKIFRCFCKIKLHISTVEPRSKENGRHRPNFP